MGTAVDKLKELPDSICQPFTDWVHMVPTALTSARRTRAATRLPLRALRYTGLAGGALLVWAVTVIGSPATITPAAITPAAFVTPVPTIDQSDPGGTPAPISSHEGTVGRAKAETAHRAAQRRMNDHAMLFRKMRHNNAENARRAHHK